jgi:hypothetical protein
MQWLLIDDNVRLLIAEIARSPPPRSRTAGAR